MFLHVSFIKTENFGIKTPHLLFSILYCITNGVKFTYKQWCFYFASEDDAAAVSVVSAEVTYSFNAASINLI